MLFRNLPRQSNFCLRRFSSESDLLKTDFYNLHLQLGGKMVPFAGYSLPVQYEGLGVLKEHVHTRTKGCASLFDVSHMGQIKWYGKDAAKFLEKIVVGDIQGLKVGEAKLSLIMNENGGIVDDTVITNAGSHIYMVVNGGCKNKDMEHFQKYIHLLGKGMDVRLAYQADSQLLALQGDGAKNVMARLAPGVNFNKMNFMTGLDATVAGIPDCRVTRCGYTGEDGFEIGVTGVDSLKLAKALLEQPEVKPAGLGARDSLRLEAGLCFYGNDIEENITPIEAGLGWTIGGPTSRRRVEQGMLGAAHFLEPNGKLKPIAKKRVGITGMKAPARSHAKVYCSKGVTQIGEITSGGFGPSCNKSIAMGYLTNEHAVEGTEVNVSIRDKMYPAKVTKMPFHPTNYFKSM